MPRQEPEPRVGVTPTAPREDLVERFLGLEERLADLAEEVGGLAALPARLEQVGAEVSALRRKVLDREGGFGELRREIATLGKRVAVVEAGVGAAPTRVEGANRRRIDEVERACAGLTQRLDELEAVLTALAEAVAA